MPSTRTLVRAAAVCIAILSVAVGIGGSMLVDVGRSMAPLFSPAALKTLDETLTITQETTATVRRAMSDLKRLADSVADSSETTAGFVADTAQITTDRVAISLAAVEQSMPGMIEAAAVIDDTLATLAIFGVDYDPAVPFDEALRDIEANLDGLSMDVGAQGQTLSSLVPEIERIGATAESLGDHIADTRQRLQEAESVLAEYRAMIDSTTPTLVSIAGMPGNGLRFAALVFALLGVTLAGLLWRLAPALALGGMETHGTGKEPPSQHKETDQ